MRFSTRLVLASLLGLAGVVTNVDAHAKLVYPIAWNSNPSKTVTCGVAQTTAAANPAMYKKSDNILAAAGGTVDVKWTVVVGDGTGPITAKLDTTAKVNPTAADFTMNLVATNDFVNKQPAVGPFTVRFTLPANLKCTGPDNTCSMRVASSSNWVACATIQLKDQLPQVAAPPAVVTTTKPVTTTQPPTTTTKPPTTTTKPATTANPGTTTQAPVVTQPPTVTDPPAATDPPATPTPTPTRDPREYYPYASVLNNCQIAAGLQTCTNINGQSVQLMGVSLDSIEQMAIEQINFDMLNPAVLERPSTTGCRQAITDLVCAQMFPPCQSDNQVVCTSTCQRVTNLCRPNATQIIDETGAMSSHAELFDCTNTKLGYTEINQDSAGVCPNVVTGDRTPTSITTTSAPVGTTQRPVSLSSSGRNHASSLQSSSATVVMGVVTLLLAFVARV